MIATEVWAAAEVSPQLGNNWVLKLSTNSCKEQAFPAGKFDFKASANSEHSKKCKRDAFFPFPPNFSPHFSLDQATEVAR